MPWHNGHVTNYSAIAGASMLVFLCMLFHLCMLALLFMLVLLCMLCMLIPPKRGADGNNAMA